MAKKPKIFSDWRKQRLFKRIVIFSVAFIFLVAAGVGVWFLRNGEFMKIVNFEVSGVTMIPAEDIISLMQGDIVRHRGMLGFILPQNHILAYQNNEKITELIKKQFPRVKEVVIVRDYSNRSMFARVIERNNKAIWCATAIKIPGRITNDNRKHCVWLDDTGVVIGKAPYSKGTLIPVITDTTGGNIFLGRTLLSEIKLTNLIFMIETLREFDFAITEIIISDQALNEATIVIDSGQKFFINLDLNLQAGARAIIDAIIASNKWSEVEHIDLRIEGKGFYKLR